MRIHRLPKSALFLACLVLAACGPSEINDEQREYVRALTLDVAEQTTHFAANAAMLAHVMNGVVLSPGGSPSSYAAQALERVERLPRCVNGYIIDSSDRGQLGILNAECSLGGRTFEFSADLKFSNGAKGPEVLMSNVQIDGFHDLFESRPVTLTYEGAERPMLRTGGDTLSQMEGGLLYEAALEFDPETYQVVLNGDGSWIPKYDGDPVPLKLSGLVFQPIACIAHGGSMQLGPIGIKVSNFQSIPVVTTVNWSEAGVASGEVLLDIDGVSETQVMQGALNCF